MVSKLDAIRARIEAKVPTQLCDTCARDIAASVQLVKRMQTNQRVCRACNAPEGDVFIYRLGWRAPTSTVPHTSASLYPPWTSGDSELDSARQRLCRVLSEHAASRERASNRVTGGVCKQCSTQLWPGNRTAFCSYLCTRDWQDAQSTG